MIFFFSILFLIESIKNTQKHRLIRTISVLFIPRQKDYFNKKYSFVLLKKKINIIKNIIILVFDLVFDSIFGYV